MRLIISNSIRVKQPTQAVIDYCKKELTIDNPDYINAQRLGLYSRNIEPKLSLYAKSGNDLILPFGCIRHLWGLDKHIDIDLQFAPFIASHMHGCINLYEYQKPALEALKKAKNGVLKAPCGSGKTNIALQLIKELGGKALWLTHTKKLLEQSKARCESYFEGDFGTITEGAVNIGSDITFATVQTMSKLDPQLYKNEFSVVVIDECHHLVGSPTKAMQFYKVINSINCRYKFGMSATLTRTDGMIPSLFALVGDIVYEIPKEAVKDKRITAEYKPIFLSQEYNVMDYTDFDGTINNTKLLSLLAENTQRNEEIVNNIVERVPHSQLVLCHRVAQCETLSKMLEERGVKTSILIGKVKEKDRDYDASVIIATYALAKEGLDIPALDTLHLASPQKNESVTIQAIGRIERNIEGKETPICYDYVDENIPYCMGCYKKRKRIIKQND